MQRLLRSQLRRLARVHEHNPDPAGLQADRPPSLDEPILGRRCSVRMGGWMRSGIILMCRGACREGRLCRRSRMVRRALVRIACSICLRLGRARLHLLVQVRASQLRSRRPIRLVGRLRGRGWRGRGEHGWQEGLLVALLEFGKTRKAYLHSVASEVSWRLRRARALPIAFFEHRLELDNTS